MYSDPSCYDSDVAIGTCHNGKGTVNLAFCKETNKPVVLKKFYLDSAEQEDYNLIEQEIVTMRQMQHPNILPYLSAFVSGHSLCVVSPLMVYGSCSDLINEYFPEGLPELAIAYILRDVLEGLEYIHKRGLIHRAIKASHILISVLGQACISGLKYSCERTEHGKWQRNIFSFPKSTAPNLKWLSPELIEQDLHGYNEKSDIYSIGVTICELANGVVPFYDMPETLMLTEKVRGCAPHIIDRSTFPRDPEDLDNPEIKPLNGDASHSSLNSMDKRVESLSTRKFSEPFHSLTEVCLQRNPKNRPSVSQLISHPFFKQCKKNDETLIDILKIVTPIHQRKIESAAGDENMTVSVQQLRNLDLETCQWDFDNT
ncbi:STE20-related kinase adapter protein alpha [Belonocnema kinseyi]|uniref:STE20-related kinase adapter protein alpha n=1 Tax=Belonocnema kinseyi TaxID=2817044 RepID=UPI00143D4304|nr:STE20-related kinase adapter protein alpha [Belonocnema kinseyi]XP_033220389.1 STE20-related kinase adapter protein alpha [Belonocnema kinseyi]XP_033220390.1 STE20-related kinase adapter protein alpha [Belonocnema kinseyi]